MTRSTPVTEHQAHRFYGPCEHPELLPNLEDRALDHLGYLQTVAVRSSSSDARSECGTPAWHQHVDRYLGTAGVDPEDYSRCMVCGSEVETVGSALNALACHHLTVRGRDLP